MQFQLNFFCEIKQNDPKIDIEKQRAKNRKRRQERRKKRLRRMNMKREGDQQHQDGKLPTRYQNIIKP